MYQYIHYEKYTLKDIIAILLEAARDLAYSPHVKKPEEPEVLLGDLTALSEKLLREVPNTRYEVKTKSHGKEVVCKKKIRADANVVLAGVASYPIALNSPDFNLDDFQKWANKVRLFLKDEFGDRLNTVVFHKDEAYPHLHFYVVPENYEMNTVCPSDRAAKQVEIANKNNPDITAAQLKGLKKQASTKALRDFQDQYFEKVGVYQGHARFGPKRLRMSRKEWVTEVATNKIIGNCISRTHNESLKTTSETKKLKKRVTELELKIQAQNTIIEEQNIMIGSWTGLGTDSPTEKKETIPNSNPGKFEI